jgi:two-component system sensor histidine kinase UhpB
VKPRSLLAHVLSVNLLLIAATGLVATLAVAAHRALLGREAVAFVLAVAATLLANWLLLRRRFLPLDELIRGLERLDLSGPASLRLRPGGIASADVERLQAAFSRLLARLESERDQAAHAAMAAQERERRRIAHDLHDEVNQSLTAVSLRLQASLEHAPPPLRPELAETKRLARQAMDELLAIARRLSPAVLEDHGLLAALDSQVRTLREQTGLVVSLSVRGEPAALTPDEQLVLYRVAQESLSNVVRHAGANAVDVSLSFDGRPTLTVTDDGRGLGPVRAGALGLAGMRERARLVGAELSVACASGGGTRVELTLP